MKASTQHTASLRHPRAYRREAEAPVLPTRMEVVVKMNCVGKIHVTERSEPPNVKFSAFTKLSTYHASLDPMSDKMAYLILTKQKVLTPMGYAWQTRSIDIQSSATPTLRDVRDEMAEVIWMTTGETFEAARQAMIKQFGLMGGLHKVQGGGGGDGSERNGKDGHSNIGGITFETKQPQKRDFSIGKDATLLALYQFFKSIYIVQLPKPPVVPRRTGWRHPGADDKVDDLPDHIYGKEKPGVSFPEIRDAFLNWADWNWRRRTFPSGREPPKYRELTSEDIAIVATVIGLDHETAGAGRVYDIRLCQSCLVP